WDAEWMLLRASDVGASHQRARVFIMAHRGRGVCEWDAGAILGAETGISSARQLNGNLSDGFEHGSAAVADGERDGCEYRLGERSGQMESAAGREGECGNQPPIASARSGAEMAGTMAVPTLDAGGSRMQQPQRGS